MLQPAYIRCVWPSMWADGVRPMSGGSSAEPAGCMPEHDCVERRVLPGNPEPSHPCRPGGGQSPIVLASGSGPLHVAVVPLLRSEGRGGARTAVWRVRAGESVGECHLCPSAEVPGAIGKVVRPGAHDVAGMPSVHRCGRSSDHRRARVCHSTCGEQPCLCLRSMTVCLGGKLLWPKLIEWFRSDWDVRG